MNTRKLIYFTGFMDLLGVSMIIPLLHLHLQKLNASLVLIGLIDSLYGGLQIFSGPLLGNWSDTKGRKPILLICVIIAAFNYFVLGLTSYLWIAISTRILLGIFKQSQSLSRAYLADITPDNQKPNVFGKFNAISSLGFIVGPTVGGHLSEVPYGFEIVCSVSSLLFLINFILICIYLPTVQPVKENEVEKEAFQAMKLITQLNWENYWDIFLVKFFLSLAVLVYRNNFTITLTKTLGLSLKSIGYVVSFYSIISSLSGFLIGYIARFYLHHSSLLQHVAILQMIALTGLTFANTLPSLIAFLIPFAISNSIARVCVTSLTVQRCRKNEKGKVVGVGQSITSGSRMIAPVLAGIAQQVTIFGPGVTGICCSITGIFFIGILNRNNQKVSFKSD
ncbi:major facilitator superfamily domain-containing protein 9-like [Centruroides vittatus]|uniref:major facilitator superfamily domain-containing protein 9-like n=1 Tax=Centruroides vittatus TaxID=120091 RepID=UPI00351071F9